MPTDLTGFPNNALGIIRDRLVNFMPDHSVIMRALRFTDPSRSLGLFAVDWTPDPTTKQIGQYEPAVSRYTLRVQNMVKASDETTGRSYFTIDAKTVRVVLYRDPVLHVGLAALTEELLGSNEAAKQWGVGRQRFLNTELNSEFTYVAQTDFWLETESIQL
jgi:hypothetical protein